MKHKLHIVVPDSFPTGNVLLRMHWTKRSQLNKSWHWIIKAWLNENNIEPKDLDFGKRRDAHIVSYRKKLADKDNLYAGAIPVTNALVKNKLLIDDSIEYVNLVVEGRIDKSNQRTEIYIS